MCVYMIYSRRLEQSKMSEFIYFKMDKSLIKWGKEGEIGEQVWLNIITNFILFLLGLMMNLCSWTSAVRPGGK